MLDPNRPPEYEFPCHLDEISTTCFANPNAIGGVMGVSPLRCHGLSTAAFSVRHGGLNINGKRTHEASRCARCRHRQ